VAGDKAELLEDFESWLLHRVAQAAEAAREVPQEEGEAAAIRQVADLVGISEERAATVLSAIDAGTTVARQRLLRGIDEAWLVWRGRQAGGVKGERTRVSSGPARRIGGQPI
jgi:hypothetical protein